MTLRLPLIICALACALSAASPAAADEVRLANGDRITGRVVSLAGGDLTLATPNGDLRIPWTSVTALSVDEPILATVGDADPVLVRITLTPDAGQLLLDPGGAVAVAQLAALVRPQPAVTIDGSANAGFVSSSGNTDANSTHIDGDLVARAGANRYTGALTITRAEDRDVESARNWSTTARYDRFLSERMFVNSNAIFTNDRFRDLRLRTALGVGLGYQILQTAIVTLTADAGLGWVNENRIGTDDNRYTAARESAALTLAVVPDLVELFHSHDGYYGVTGDDNLFVRTQNGVRVSLAAGFVTTLRLDMDYNKSPAPDRRNTDKTVALTLGYRF